MEETSQEELVGEQRVTREMENPSANSETLISEPELDSPSTCFQASSDSHEEDIGESKPSSFSQTEIFKALEVVERDSLAIAESFTSLFSSLRVALSQVTGSSVDHMRCFSDAAGHLQESALDAATKGNRYINSCLRLNEEVKGIDGLASQLYPFNLVLNCARMLYRLGFDCTPLSAYVGLEDLSYFLLGGCWILKGQ